MTLENGNNGFTKVELNNLIRLVKKEADFIIPGETEKGHYKHDNLIGVIEPCDDGLFRSLDWIKNNDLKKIAQKDDLIEEANDKIIYHKSGEEVYINDKHIVILVPGNSDYDSYLDLNTIYVKDVNDKQVVDIINPGVN